MKVKNQLAIDVSSSLAPLSLSGAGASLKVTSLNADLLDDQQGSYYLDWANFTGKPTSLGGYGITDAINTSGTAQTKSGSLTLGNTLSIQNVDPRIIFNETDAPAEWKRHDWINQNGYFVGRFYNDAGTASHTWLTVARAAASPVATSITLNAATVSITGALTVSSTLNAVGAITQNGSQVLHAGNYNTYAPTLTGTGASGTWGISISGNAATATLAGKMTTLLANDGAALPGSYYSLGGSFVSFLSSTGGSASNYPAEGDGGGAGIVVHRDNDANGTPATGSFQLWASTGQDNTVNNLWFRKYGLTPGGGGTRSWGSWVKLFHSGNSGTGSLLDADKLDGQEGSYYLAWANLTGKPTTLSGYGITDALNTSSNAQTKAGSLTINGTLSVVSNDARQVFTELDASVDWKRSDWINQNGQFVGRFYKDDGTASHTWITVSRAASSHVASSINLNATTTSVTGNLSITGGVGAIAMHVVSGRARFGHATAGSGLWFDGDGSDYLWFAGLTGTSFRLWNNNVNRLILTTGGALTVPGAATFGSATISTSLTVNTSLTVLGGGTFRNGTAGQSVNIGPLDSGQTGNAGALNLYTGAGNHWHQVVRGDQHPSAPNWWSLFYYDGVFNTALVINTSREFGFGGNPATGYRVSVSGNTYMAGDLVMGTGYEIRATDGTAAAPGYTFSAESDVGLFRPATDILGFSTAGTERMRIRSGGLVQIGSTAAPNSFESNLKLLVGDEWITSSAIAQFGGFTRSGFHITHDSVEGMYPNVSGTGRIGTTTKRYASGYFSTFNVGDHAAVYDQGSGTSLQVAPRILSGDLYGTGDAQSNSWNWLQGLVTGMGYPDSPALLGAFQNNLLANWVRRGGSASTSVSGGASWSNPSNTYEPPFSGKHRARSYATLANATGTPNTLTIELTDPQTTQSSSNSLVYTFTNMTLWVPYVVFRTTANITNIKVEINVGSDNTTPGYQTIFDAAPQFVKSTLWRGPVFRPTSGGYALFGIKFTFTHAGGGTSAEILEIGLADNWGIHGRHMWASPWATQAWTAQQTFNAPQTFNGLTYLQGDVVFGAAGTLGRMYVGTTGGANTRSFFAGRNAADTDFRWDAEFGWDGSSQRWYFDQTPYVGADQIWHAGNDGAGSGLHADILDGRHLSTAGDRWDVVPFVGNDGVMEVGRYIDFNNSDGAANDAGPRLDTGGTETDLFIEGKKIAKVHAATIGDGYATSYNVDHNFGTKDVHVQIVRVSDGVIASYATSVAATTSDRVVVTFASPPTASQYRVVVIG
jgi:hypothetical protein